MPVFSATAVIRSRYSGNTPLARRAALSDDKLRGIGDRLGTVTTQLKSLVPGLKDGSFNPADIAKLAAGLGGATALAQTLGVNVKELPVPSLGG